MKKSEEMRLKSRINESTLSTAARSPFPDGEGSETRIPLFSTQRLPLVGKVASGASRIGFQRYEKERGNASQVEDKREHPIHRCAVPLPQWGRQRYEDTAIPEIKPSPRGEGGERSEPDRVLAV